MRTENLQSLLWRTARKLGLDPATSLLDLQAHPLLTYLLEGLREAWDSWDWNFTKVIEQRWYYPPYTPGVINPVGVIIYDPITGIYWKTLYAGDSGSPSTYPNFYQQVTLAGQVSILAQPYILDAPLLSPPPPPPPIQVPNTNLVIVPSVVPFSAPQSIWGLNSDGNPYQEIGTVFGVFATDPRLSTFPIEVQYSISPRGIELFDTQLTNVWVVYRPPFPVVGVENWSSTAAYNPNDSVFYNQDMWYCIAANTNVIPGTDNGVNWVAFRPPAAWGTAVTAYAYGRALEEDGQSDKAQVQDMRFMDLLSKLYDREQNEQGQTSFWSTIVK